VFLNHLVNDRQTYDLHKLFYPDSVAGGGSSVEMTDICARTGLKVLLLQEETQKEISRLVPEANTSCKNPVDLGFFGFFPQVYGQAIRQTAKDPHIDVLMLYQLTEYFAQFNAEFNLPPAAIPPVSRSNLAESQIFIYARF